MAKYTEAKAVEHLGEVLEEKIIDTLDYWVKERSARLSNPNLSKDALRRLRTSTEIKSISDRIKRLKRGLGGVILTDPQHYKNTGLFKLILDKTSNMEDWISGLDAALGSWDGQMHFTDRVSQWNPKGKVGHHRTALSVMRDALLESPKNVRSRFKELALADGYKLGEEFVDYIDPVAHKGFNNKIHGMLKDKGYFTKSDPRINQDVMKELIERSAHSKLFGDTTGFNFPKELVAKNASAEDIYKVARPYLEMTKMSADQGLAFDKIVTEGKWNTPEELLDLVKANAEIDAGKTEALVNRMNVDLYEAGHVDPSGYSKIKGKADQWGANRAALVPDPVSRGQTIEDIYKNVWEPIDDKALKTLPFNQTADAVRPVTRAGVRALAVGGALTAVGALGTGVSAAETYGRAHLAKESGNVVDWLQFGISGISLGADAASYNPLFALPGSLVSTAADVTNIAIDSARDGPQKIRGRSGAKKAIQARKEEEEYNLL